MTSLKDFLEVISESEYCRKSTWLSGATIGQHMRHILEFYTCLLAGAVAEQPVCNDRQFTIGNTPIELDQCVVNYDKRARDYDIETKPEKAIETIDAICDKLSGSTVWPEQLFVEGYYEQGSDEVQSIESSFERELLYNLEHTIHHQALIRVGLLEQNMAHLLDESFGVAPSTIRARK
ncbi:MAG: DinB family protein [Cyclonatronaceae bacterium]